MHVVISRGRVAQENDSSRNGQSVSAVFLRCMHVSHRRTPQNNMLAVEEVIALNRFLEIVGSPEGAVVLFFTPWCSICKKLGPIFERVSEAEAFKKIRFCKVDLEKQVEITNDVSNVPEIATFRNGVRVAARNGIVGQDELEDWIRKLYAPNMTSEKNCGLPQSTAPERPMEDEHSYTIQSQVMCTGKFEQRRRRPLFLPKNRKRFSDLEPNCIFQPTPEDTGVQIGRANDSESYFAIILWNSPQDDPGTICFTIDFMPDPVNKARFESAIFSVSFGRDSTDGTHLPLNVRDLFPTDEEDMATRRLPNHEHDGYGPTVDADNSSNSFSEYDTTARGTQTRLRGQGLHSPTAVWTFSDDKTGSSRKGLDAHYDLFVSVQSTSRVGMEFWGKAVLVSGDDSGLGLKHRVTLKVGSMEAPYKRILDLSVVMRQDGEHV